MLVVVITILVMQFCSDCYNVVESIFSRNIALEKEDESVGVGKGFSC